LRFKHLPWPSPRPHLHRPRTALAACAWRPLEHPPPRPTSGVVGTVRAAVACALWPMSHVNKAAQAPNSELVMQKGMAVVHMHASGTGPFQRTNAPFPFAIRHKPPSPRRLIWCRPAGTCAWRRPAPAYSGGCRTESTPHLSSSTAPPGTPTRPSSYPFCWTPRRRRSRHSTSP